MILTLYKRFQAYETLGALFRDTQKEMLEKTLCERIEMVILKILHELLEYLCIDVQQTLYQLTSTDRAAKNIITLLNAVNQFDNGSHELNKAS
jgi:DNA topoisomerase VI subunit B